MKPGDVLMKKNRLLQIVIILLFVLLGVMILPMTFFHLSGLLLPTPSVPINKYGEFPFRIVYEIGDERFIVEDTLICEYAGRNRESFTGREIKWNEQIENQDLLSRGFYLSSVPEPGNEWSYGCVYKLLGDVSVGDGIIGGVYIDIGGAPYYLGYYTLEGYYPGTVFNDIQGDLSKDALLEQYEIRIIETTFSEPMTGGNGIVIALSE